MAKGMKTRAQTKQEQPENEETDADSRPDDPTTQAESKGNESNPTEDKHDMSYEERLARGLISEDKEEEAKTEQRIEKIKNHISESWVEIVNAIDEVAFNPIDRRLPTKFWYSVSQEYRNLTADLDSEEFNEEKQHILEAIDKGLTASETTDLRDMGWKFAKGMAKLVLKKKYEEHVDLKTLFILAMRLSRTEASELDKANYTGTDDIKIRTMWVISQQLFGDTSPNNHHHVPIFKKDTKTTGSKLPLWQKIKNTTTEQFELKDFEDLNGDNPWRQLDRINYLKGIHNVNYNINDWKIAANIAMNTMNRTAEDTEMTNFFVKLAHTPPEHIPGWNATTSELWHNQFSVVWVAIHQILGVTWTDNATWDTDSTTTVSMATKKKYQRSKKRQNTREGPPVTNIHYVQRDNMNSKKHKLDDEWDRKYLTYFKIRLPPVDDIDSTQEEISRAADFNDAMSIFWSSDEQAIIHPWLTYVKDKPLEHNSDLHNTRDFVNTYTARFYVTEGKGGSYLRFKVGHNCDLDDIMRSDAVTNLRKNKSIYILVDKIQAQRVKLAGWWAGSINSRSGIDDLESTLKMQPLAQQNNIKNIEIRIGQVNNSDKFEFLPPEQRVFAMHIYTDFESTAALRTLLMQLYPAKPRKDYPMGRQMRFVPNIADTRFMHPPGSREKADQLKRKQALFLKSLQKTTTSEIVKLYRPLHTKPYPSLLQVLTSWKSPQYEHERLFVAVEETYQEVAFYYLEKNKDTAEAIVPLLGIVLEEEYGPETWDWFSKNARMTGTQYTYHKDVKLIKPKQVEQVDEEWDLGIPDEEGQDTINLDFQIDIGTIELNHRTTNVLDDQSIGTLGMRSQSDQSLATRESGSDNSNNSDSSITMATKRNWNAEIEEIEEGDENEEKDGDDDASQSATDDQLSVSSDITMATRNKSAAKAKPKQGNASGETLNRDDFSMDGDDDITMASRRPTRPPHNPEDSTMITPPKPPPAPDPEDNDRKPSLIKLPPDDGPLSDDDDLPLSEWIKKQEQIQEQALQNNSLFPPGTKPPPPTAS